jgi:hypothetical protein
MAISENVLQAIENKKRRRLTKKLHTKNMHFNPEWLEDGWIAHQLDRTDIRLLRENLAHTSPSLQALMLEDGFDEKNGCIHMYWGKEKKTFCHNVNSKLLDTLDSLEVNGMKVPEIANELRRAEAEDKFNVFKFSLLDIFARIAKKAAITFSATSEKSLSTINKDKSIEYKYLFKLINHQGLKLDTGKILSQYNGNAIDTLWEGMNRRALDTLRSANPQSDTLAEGEKVNAFQLELEWIASKQYDAVCRLLGMDSNQIRACLPKILESYDRPITGYCHKLVRAFHKLNEQEAIVLDNLEAHTSFTSKVEVRVGNDKTFADVKKAKDTDTQMFITSNEVFKKAQGKENQSKSSRSKKSKGKKVLVEPLNQTLIFI